MAVMGNPIIISNLVRISDLLNTNYWKFSKVSNKRVGEAFNNQYSENSICGYAGAFYNSPNEFLTIFVGYSNDYGYCISLCARKDRLLATAIENLRYKYTGEWNSFDKHYWYTMNFNQINFDKEIFAKLGEENISVSDIEDIISLLKIDEIVTKIINELKKSISNL